MTFDIHSDVHNIRILMHKFHKTINPIEKTQQDVCKLIILVLKVAI